MTPIRATRRHVSVATRNAAGTAISSATISSRNACSLRAAALRPFQLLSVARRSRSTLLLLSKTGNRRQRLGAGGAFGLEQIGHQESHFDGLLGVEPRVAQRVVTRVQSLVGDRMRAAGALGD